MLVGAHHVGDVFFCLNVANFCIRVVLVDAAIDRVDQVGLAAADAAIYEQRVVARARVACDLPGGRAGELVGFAGYERGRM